MPSPSLYSGLNTKIGFGNESTWGTTVSRTNWHCVEQGGVTATKRRPRAMRPTLCGGTGGIPKSTHATMKDVSGDVSILMRYTGCGLPLRAALGDVTESGAGPYVHTFKLSAPASIPSLTGELIRGTSGYSEVFHGLMVSRATWTVSPGGLMVMRMSLLGEDSDARGAAGTPTDGDDVPVIFSDCGALAFNSVNYTPRSFELTLDNKLERRDALGTELTTEPYPTTFREIVLRVGLDADELLYAAQLAGTQSDVTIVFTSGTTSMAFTVHNAEIFTYDEPISTVGVVPGTVEFRALDDGTNLGMTIANTNGDATYDIN